MARKVQKLYQTPAELLAGYFPEQTKEEKEKLKEPIKLRAKPLKNCLSLYLDLYNAGKREYEFLKLYLNIEGDLSVKERNLESLDIAKTILYEKIALLKKTGAGFVSHKSKVSLTAYVLFQAEEAFRVSGNKHSLYYTLQSLAKHIAVYSGEQTQLKQVNKAYVLGFIEYLKTACNFNFQRTGTERDVKKPLSLNTQHNLFMKFKYVLRKAVKAGIINSSPMDLLENREKPKEEEGTRVYLTIEEVKALIATPCRNDLLKRAFLFSCLTGLRYSDVSSIKWGEIQKDVSGDILLRFKMQKVKRANTVYLSDEALKWLPNRDFAPDNATIFPISKNESANKQLAKWVADAGITKKITFHCSRHTAATLNLALGVPLELVQKIMGHSKVATTQIYAKILDENLKKAVAKQNGVFD